VKVKHPLEGVLLDQRYKILDPIARGGVGLVFEAHDCALERRVAIKVVTNTQSRESIFRLQREAVLIAGINHVNVCTVFDTGRLPDGLPYVVMERLYGETVAERTRANAAPPIHAALAMDIVLQLLSGLSAAHGRHVIHRDLKPSNLFLVDRGRARPPLVKILDFGFAKDLSRPPDGGYHTNQGIIVGTPRYMAPEVLYGGTASIFSDIFSCGLILCELLTGEHPYNAAGRNPLLIAEAVRNGPRIDFEAKGLSQEVEWVLLKALATTPEQRFSTAREMRYRLSKASKVRLHPGSPLPKLDANWEEDGPSSGVPSSGSSRY
jgi:eukaryotic-like serine/threonine-protein kinase